jgi:hypothetical protein
MRINRNKAAHLQCRQLYCLLQEGKFAAGSKLTVKAPSPQIVSSPRA